jgi:hypothetical protein
LELSVSKVSAQEVEIKELQAKIEGLQAAETSPKTENARLGRKVEWALNDSIAYEESIMEREAVYKVGKASRLGFLESMKRIWDDGDFVDVSSEA